MLLFNSSAADVSQIDGLPLEDFLELSSLAMTDPISKAPLVSGGADIDVTMENVNDYVEMIATR